MVLAVNIPLCGGHSTRIAVGVCSPLQHFLLFFFPAQT